MILMNSLRSHFATLLMRNAQMSMDKKLVVVGIITLTCIGLSGCLNADKASVDWKLDVAGYSVNPVSGSSYIEKGGSEIFTFTVYCSHKQDFKLNQKQTSSDCWVSCPESFSNYVGNTVYKQKQITITISTSSFASQETVYLEYVPVNDV